MMEEIQTESEREKRIRRIPRDESGFIMYEYKTFMGDESGGISLRGEKQQAKVSALL